MSALNFKISATLEAAGFKQAADYLKTLSTETQKNRDSNKEHAGTVDTLKLAYAGLVGLGVVEFFKSAYEEAAQAREQEIQLGNRVEQTGLSYENAKPKLDAFFEALQNQSGIAKDKLIPAFNELIDKTGSVRASQELLNTTMGLARARGLQLSEAAQLVAGAYNGEQRALGQLARMMGMTTEEAKNHDLVLAKIKERYAGLATNTDQTALAMARLQNAYKDFKESVGAGMSGMLKDDLDSIRVISAAAIAVFQVIGAGLGAFADRIGIQMDQIKNTFKIGFKKAAELADEEIKKLEASTTARLEKIGEAAHKMMNPEEQSGGGEVDVAEKKYAKLSAMQLAFIEEGNVAAAYGNQKQLEAKLKYLNAAENAEKESIKQTNEYRNLAAEDQEKIESAIHKKYERERAKERQTAAKVAIELAAMTGKAVGLAMADMMTGQEDAWKNMLKGIIDAVAHAAEGYVAMWVEAEVLKDLASEDYAGAAAAALVGGIAVGAIEGLAGAAKSSIGGGSGGGSSLSTVGSASTSTTGAPASTTSTGTNSSVTIYVQGDIVDSDTFMNSLAARLSDKVQNQDIKLVASSVAP